MPPIKMTYSVQEATTHLSKLLDLVEQGEEVVITREGTPVARLIAIPKSTKPKLGTMRQEITWVEGWEKPLTDQQSDEFLNGH